MRIYVSHSRALNFEEELYKPLEEYAIASGHQFIFPHDISMSDYPSRSLFESRGCDMVLAEVSLPSTGQGIELGWANTFGVRIIAVHKAGSTVSSSLSHVTKDSFEYKNSAELIYKLSKILK